MATAKLTLCLVAHALSERLRAQPYRASGVVGDKHNVNFAVAISAS